MLIVEFEWSITKRTTPETQLQWEKEWRKIRKRESLKLCLARYESGIRFVDWYFVAFKKIWLLKECILTRHLDRNRKIELHKY